MHAIIEVLTPLLMGCGAVAVIGIPAIVLKFRLARKGFPSAEDLED